MARENIQKVTSFLSRGYQGVFDPSAYLSVNASVRSSTGELASFQVQIFAESSAINSSFGWDRYNPKELDLGTTYGAYEHCTDDPNWQETVSRIHDGNDQPLRIGIARYDRLNDGICNQGKSIDQLLSE